MFYMNANLPSKSLIQKINNEAKTIFVEVNTQSSKWLLVGCYKPLSQHKKAFSNKQNICNKIWQFNFNGWF